MTEHRKKDIPVGKHVWRGCDKSSSFDWRIIDQCNVSQKRMSPEALHISHIIIHIININTYYKKKSRLNTRYEYRNQELTLKY